MKDKINVLGTEYEIKTVPAKELPDKAGDTDFYTKVISLSDLQDIDFEESTKDIEAFKRHSLRHEIFHAFMFESGLDMQSGDGIPWALNEEMVDWHAIQSPKIYKVFEELNILR